MVDDELRTCPPRQTSRQVAALLDHGLVKDFDYIVVFLGSLWKAINGRTGIVDFSNADIGSVIQSCIGTGNVCIFVSIIGTETTATQLDFYEKTKLVLVGTYQYTGALSAAFINHNQNTPGTSTPGIEIHFGTIIGNPDADLHSSVISFARAPNAFINRVTIQEAGGYAISFDGGGDRSEINECVVLNCGKTVTSGGIYLGGQIGNTQSRVKVLGGFISGSGQHGIYNNHYSLNSQIIGVEITAWGGVGDDGSAISMRGDGGLVDGCYLHDATGNSGGGIGDLSEVTNQAVDVTVTNNKIVNCGSNSNGILVYGGSWKITQNTITGCLRGIYLFQSSFSQLIGNDINNNTGDAITLYNGAAYNLITGVNKLRNNGANGVTIWDAGTPCLHNQIKNNLISDNTAWGIRTFQATNQTEIAGNTYGNNGSGNVSLVDVLFNRDDLVINLTSIPVNAGWTFDVVGSGKNIQNASFIEVYTDTTANSTSSAYTKIYVISAGTQYWDTIDKNNVVEFAFAFGVQGAVHADTAVYIHVKGNSTNADLASVGFGLKVENNVLTGESYGSSGLGTIALGTITIGYVKTIKIRVIPGVGVVFWVNSVYVGFLGPEYIPNANISSANMLCGVSNGDNASTVNLTVGAVKIGVGEVAGL